MSGTTYTIAGYSTKNGQRKFRVANGSAAARAAVLRRDGHTEITLVDLPNAMTREQAEAHMAAKVTPAAPAVEKSAEEIAHIKEVNLQKLRETSAHLDKMVEVA
jgi:hypothetical protein